MGLTNHVRKRVPMFDPETSDLSLPNFAKLYEEAVQNLLREGLVGLSDREAVTLGVIIQTATRGQSESALGARIAQELDEFQLPKWVALVSWLSPYGLCASEPGLIHRIANYLLGYTRRQEESAVPLAVRERMGID